jgi:hypothetical protein
MSDPKGRFLQYVAQDQAKGGGQPKGKGFITEKQRQGLQPGEVVSRSTEGKIDGALFSWLTAGTEEVRPVWRPTPAAGR